MGALRCRGLINASLRIKALGKKKEIAGCEFFMQIRLNLGYQTFDYCLLLK